MIKKSNYYDVKNVQVRVVKLHALILLMTLLSAWSIPSHSGFLGGSSGRETPAQRERRLAAEKAEKERKEKEEREKKEQQERQEQQQRDLEEKARREREAKEKAEEEEKKAFDAQVTGMRAQAEDQYSRYLDGVYNGLDKRWQELEKTASETASIGGGTTAEQRMKDLITDVFDKARVMSGEGRTDVAMRAREKMMMFNAFKYYVELWATEKVKNWNQ